MQDLEEDQSLRALLKGKSANLGPYMEIWRRVARDFTKFLISFDQVLFRKAMLTVSSRDRKNEQSFCHLSSSKIIKMFVKKHSAKINKSLKLTQFAFHSVTIF